jgi:malonyl-CoA O-methyltransferase
MSIQKSYDEWSQTYDADGNLTRDLDQKVTREALAEQHFHSILEIGCGTGKNTVFLSEIADIVQAVDFSEGMIEKAREKVQAGSVRFSMMDITQTWNFEPQAFDLVLCNLVLEHIENLDLIFSEAARVLKAGGKFFISELHPFRQYVGKKARFYRENETMEVDAYVHHISDFLDTAAKNGLVLIKLSEHWHEQDSGKPPRLVSFLMEKAGYVQTGSGKQILNNTKIF